MLYHTFLLLSLEVSVCGCPSVCHLARAVSVLPLGLCLQCTLHTSYLSPGFVPLLVQSAAPAPLCLYHFVSLLASSGPCLYDLSLFCFSPSHLRPLIFVPTRALSDIQVWNGPAFPASSLPAGLGSGGILRQESGIDGHCVFLELLLESPS